MNDVKKTNTSNSKANNTKIKKVQLVKLQALCISICFSVLQIKKFKLSHHISNCEENHTANNNTCEFKMSIENKTTKYSQQKNHLFQ